MRPKLQRHFPNIYKGKDGNQRLLRDTRLLKIACNGKIPEQTPNERDDLQELIRKGKSKVAEETGMPEDTDNFLIREEMEQSRLDRGEDSDDDEANTSTVLSQSKKNPSTATVHSNVNEQLMNNFATPQYPTMQTHMPMIPSNNHMYMPNVPMFSPQSGNFYFGMENSHIMQPYPVTYQHHQYTGTYPQHLIQNQPTCTTSTSLQVNPLVPQHEIQSTFTPTTLANVAKNDNVTQSTVADQNVTLLDLANAANMIDKQ
jgi:hypothetical protein